MVRVFGSSLFAILWQNLSRRVNSVSYNMCGFGSHHEERTIEHTIVPAQQVPLLSAYQPGAIDQPLGLPNHVKPPNPFGRGLRGTCLPIKAAQQNLPTVSRRFFFPYPFPLCLLP
jgi:hypothetical protein